MEDFVHADNIKRLFRQCIYINLGTHGQDGWPHQSNVRVSHGHSLSLYFLTEKTSEKSKNIQSDQRVSGSLLIGEPKPGTGVNFYFNGIATRLSYDEPFPSLLPAHYDERKSAIEALCKGRRDYANNMNDILAGRHDLEVHRIALTKAWFNGGIINETPNGTTMESNAKKSLRIVGDKSCPIIRRYLIDSRQPMPDWAVELPEDTVQKALTMNTMPVLAA